MKTKYEYNGVVYTFSNLDLKEGDEVYPISDGRCYDDGSYEHHEFRFDDYLCGFPNDPHIIIDLHHSEKNGNKIYKPYEIRTSHGYGPKEEYFKIIKQTKNENSK